MKILKDKFFSNFPILLILAFYAVTRIVVLGDLPWGMANDEVDTGYEAYSILRTGKDQWGNYFPLTEFKGFGDYRLPLYIYLTVPFIAIFGLSSIAVRMPVVLSGLGGVWLTYRIVSKISNRAGLISALILSFSPWFFGLTRFATESSLALVLVLAAVDQLISNRNRSWGMILAGTFLSFSLFAYTSVRLFLPTFILGLISIYGLKYKKSFLIKTKSYWNLYKIPSLFVFLMATLAFGAISFSSVRGMAIARLQQVGFFRNQEGLVILDLANTHLASCQLIFVNPVCRFLNNRPFYMGDVFIRNFLNHFSLGYLFLEQNINSGFIPRGGLLYTSIIPGLLVGWLWLFKTNSTYRKWLIFYSIWMLSAVFPSSLTGGGHYLRAFFMIFPLVATTGIGIDKIFDKKRLVGWLVLSLLGLQITKFLMDYFSYFPVYHARYSQAEYRQVMQYLKDLPDVMDRKVYMSSRYFDSKQYMFYLFYFKLDPEWYQHNESKDWLIEDNGWIKVTRVGNWNFLNSMPDWKIVDDGSLIIGSYKEEIQSLIGDGDFSDCQLGRLKLIQRFLYPDGGEAMTLAKWEKNPDYDLQQCESGTL